MSENTKIWNILGRTDPRHTKSFKRAGGFSGTAIKPMFSYLRMTEQFGPCGLGWGVGKPTFQVVPGENREIVVYCTASIWYREIDDEEPRTVYGVGGDKVVSYIKANEQYNRPERWETDDEAFKKAFTDAVTNALKLIGVGADVHMGMFDDSKYVNTMKQEFADDHRPSTPNTVTGPALVAANQTAKSSASLKRDGAWQKLYDELQNDFVDCHSLASLHKLRIIYRQKAVDEGFPQAWLGALKNEFDAQEDALKKSETLLAGE